MSDDNKSKATRMIFYFIAIIGAALELFAYRYHFDTRMAVPYMDIADAYLNRDWNNAINTTWSPMYSWLIALCFFTLKPTSYWETSCVHVVNFFIFLFTLISFEYFLNNLLIFYKNVSSKAEHDKVLILPEWLIRALSYNIFLLSSFFLIKVSKQSPDMCLFAFVYLICALLLKLKFEMNKSLVFCFLGVSFALGYLTKSVMLPISVFFFISGFFIVKGNLKKLQYVIISLFTFCLIAGPFINAISKKNGHFTFGGPGKLNYAWYIHDLEDWIINDNFKGYGKPVHPLNKIYADPLIYKFNTPFTNATYPPTYDENYLMEGVKLHFDLARQIKAFFVNLHVYYKTFFQHQSELLIGLFALLFLSKNANLFVKEMRNYWFLIIPCLFVLILYSLVHVEERYVAGFIVILWICIILSLRFEKNKETINLINKVTTALLVFTIIKLSFLQSYYVLKITSDFFKANPNEIWTISEKLKESGIGPGDQIISINDDKNIYWARLSKAKIRAELFSDNAYAFWELSEGARNNIIKLLKNLGARAIVTQDIPSYIRSSALKNGWQQVTPLNLNYFILFLNQ